MQALVPCIVYTVLTWLSNMHNRNTDTAAMIRLWLPALNIAWTLSIALVSAARAGTWWWFPHNHLAVVALAILHFIFNAVLVNWDGNYHHQASAASSTGVGIARTPPPPVLDIADDEKPIALQPIVEDDARRTLNLDGAIIEALPQESSLHQAERSLRRRNNGLGRTQKQPR